MSENCVIPEFHPALRAFENPLILTSPDIIAPMRAAFDAYGAAGVTAFNQVLNAVKVGLAESIHEALLLSLGLMVLTLLMLCFLKEIPLRRHHQEEQ